MRSKKFNYSKLTPYSLLFTVHFLLFTISCSLLTSCAGDPLFNPIGNKLSAPIAIALDTDRSRAYVVNSNLNAAFEGATLSILKISDPSKPVLLDDPDNPIPLRELSGQAFLDADTQRLFITNRFSPNKSDVIDDLIRVDVSENSNLGKQKFFEAGENPFGIACCDDQARFYVVSDGTLEVFELDDPSQKITVDLSVTLSDGGSFNGQSTTRVALLNNQAFLSNRAGVIYVINTDKIDGSDDNPIDYLITELNDLRGIATDGTNLYVVEEDFDDSDVTHLRALDLSAIPPIAEVSGDVIEKAIDSDGLEKQQIGLGLEPEEIIVFNDRAYVSNSESNTVSVINISNPDSLETATTIKLNADGFKSDGPFGLAAATFDETDLLYVTNLNSNNISMVNLDSQKVIGTFP